MTYKKHSLPLESNPEVFNELLQLLNPSSELAFEDVFTLDEPELLPRPALALVLVFPTTPSYEARKAEFEAARTEHTGSGDGEPVVWFKQTISNACGLYAMLHAASNGTARRFIKPGSLLARLLQECTPLQSDERAKVLENSIDLEQAYAAVATKGDSAVPDNPEDEVDFHYICFVASNEDNGRLFELDGDCKGPVDTGVILEGNDLLCPEVIRVIRQWYIDAESGSGNYGFNMLALVHRYLGLA